MKTKKIVITVLTVALITAFILGCSVPLDDTNLGVIKETKSAPEGKTLVRLNLVGSDSKALTVKPNLSGVTISSFPYFLLIVDNISTTSEIFDQSPFDDYFEYADFSNDLLLTTGDVYHFIVIACSDNDDSTVKYLAWGEDTETISGSGDTITIVLSEIVGNIPTAHDEYNSTGTFKWDLSSYSYDTANLTLTSLATSTAVSTIDGLDVATTASTGSEDIPSGYYTLTLELGGSKKQTVYVRDVVHIYSGYESIYQPLTLPTLRTNVYTITFNYGTDNAAGDLSGTRDLTEEITHGELFSSISNDNPPHSDATHNVFEGWYTNSGTTPIGTTKALKARSYFVCKMVKSSHSW